MFIYILFFRLLVDGHWGCFYLLAVRNNAAGKVFCVDMFLVLLGLYLGVQFLGQIVALHLAA